MQNSKARFTVISYSAFLFLHIQTFLNKSCKHWFDSGHIFCFGAPYAKQFAVEMSTSIKTSSQIIKWRTLSHLFLCSSQQDSRLFCLPFDEKVLINYLIFIDHHLDDKTKEEYKTRSLKGFKACNNEVIKYNNVDYPW